MPTLPATGIPAGPQQPQQQEDTNFLNLACFQSKTLPQSTDTALRERCSRASITPNYSFHDGGDRVQLLNAAGHI